MAILGGGAKARGALILLVLIASVFLAAAGPASAWAPGWDVLWHGKPGVDSSFRVGRLRPDGSVIVAGALPFTHPATNKSVIAKYARTGKRLWVRAWGDGPLPSMPFTKLGFDSEGSVYAAGLAVDDLGTFESVALVKYAHDGHLLWTNDSALGNLGDVSLDAFRVDRGGYSYIAARVNRQPGGLRLLVAKLRPDGTLVWMIEDDQIGVNGLVDIAVRPAGDVYVTGTGSGQSGGQVCMTARYSSEGKLLWRAGYSPPGAHWCYGTDALVNADGVTVLGGSWPEGSWPEHGVPAGVFVLRYTPGGELAWHTTCPSTLNGEVWAETLVNTKDGGVLVGLWDTSGEVPVPEMKNQTVIAKFDAAGELSWATPVVLSGKDRLKPLKERTDGTIVAGGYSGKNAAAALLAADGTLLWSGRYALPDHRVFRPTWSGATATGVYAAGWSWDESRPRGRAALVRIRLPR
jgi:hypothetical protein